ncbi:hypothetical protein QFZ35_003919 [Arthrobacter ulcerisalmonis]|uniref:hypothetical protein n=1 Tax=Arthrobacter sp. B1I2 TaxID=3042263 RepID=UPI00278B53E7|nr:MULTISPECIES: hypothetical protein [Arthrobacter]MDQ0665421.1 hypothetical protein [Arthrobacter ulcerisalmonis]MDQ0733130.1 hypothetical protein [Arthrobacter sp. B1I2]
MLAGFSSAVRQTYKHRPVQDVHVLPGNFHRFLNMTGAERRHERDVFVIGLVQLLDGIWDEVVIQLREGLVVDLDGGLGTFRAG